MGSIKYSLLSLVAVLINKKRYGSDITTCSHFILFRLSNVMMLKFRSNHTSIFALQAFVRHRGDSLC